MSDAFCLTFLPEEICVHILGFIEDPNSLLVVARTNRQLNRLVQDDLLWQHLFLKFSYHRTQRDEDQKALYKALFKREYTIDHNWRHLDNHVPYEIQQDTPRLGLSHHRVVTSLVSSGGTRPVVATAYSGSHVQVYDLGNRFNINVPGDDVRTVALILDKERLRDYRDDEALSAGVFRGWGTNGLLLVTGGRKLKVWNIPPRTGFLTHTMQDTAGIRCLCGVNGTSQLLSGARNGNVKLWDIQTGTLIRAFSSFADGVLCLDTGYDDQGQLLAVGGSTDGSGRIWDLNSDDFKVLSGHCQSIRRIKMNGGIVISASTDSTIRTWSLTTGEPLCVITTHKMPAILLTVVDYPVRSLVSIGFEGTVAVHHLEDEMGEQLLIPNSSKGFNLHCKGVIDAGNCNPYFVSASIDGVMSIFRPVKVEAKTALDSLEGKSMAPVELIRRIPTGFSILHRVAVVRQGIITIGASETGRICMRYYDFAIER